MDFTYDRTVDACYIDLDPTNTDTRSKQVFVYGEEDRYDLILDLGIEGRILGIEIIGASAALAPDLLRRATIIDADIGTNQRP